MSAKKLIIILVFIGLVIGIVIWNNKKSITDNNNSKPKSDDENPDYDYGGKDNDGDGNGSGGNGGSSVDPQLKQSKPNIWYQQTANSLYNLSEGTTNSDEEKAIMNLIAQCKTYQDVLLLDQEYTKLDSWGLTKMVYYELDGKGQIAQLNSMLKNNGCTYQF